MLRGYWVKWIRNCYYDSNATDIKVLGSLIYGDQQSDEIRWGEEDQHSRKQKWVPPETKDLIEPKLYQARY